MQKKYSSADNAKKGKVKMQKIKRIPYGKSDFEAIHCENRYYIDKTMFIPEIEKTDYIFLIRPRRFGKSLFLSMLYSYYDINRSDRFEKFYKGTWIFDNPTEERAKYMIMYFNFSVISKEKDKVQEDFNDYCLKVINHFMLEYKKYISKECFNLVKKDKTAHQKLQTLSIGLAKNPIKLYILIDEYDNFTNTLLSEYGVEEYSRITKKEGYFKDFFTLLKGMTSGSGAGLARMFITGVSPITMDDVTSGMNIGNNISIDEAFNEVMGFTEKDVSDIIDYYASVGVFKLDKAESMKIMKQWYDGYKFAKRAKNTMYNTDMILHYMNKSDNSDYIPDNLIDDNVKTDYGKFKHFTTINNIASGKVELNGNFSMLEQIVMDDYIDEKLVTSFPYQQITEPENFISLLFYFGLITIDKIKRGKTRFKIPNESVKTFLNSFVRKGYFDAYKVQGHTYELINSLGDMMYDGTWKKPINLIAGVINDGMCARDKIEGERYIQAFFKAQLGLSDAMIVSSERSALDGYTDIAIAPHLAQYPDIEYAFLIEMKYLKSQEEYNEKGIAETAKIQLAKYAEDKNINKEWQIKPNGNVTLKKIILIFHGRELKYAEEI